MMERQFRILWGPTFETVLDFSYPVVGDAPLLWRGLRAGSERVDGATTADVSLTGRDYFLGVTAKWFDLAHAAGATGLQAFIDWANAGNSFTLVPDPINLPTLKVAGCFLEEPFLAPSWSVETGGEMTVNLVIRHPTQDLGLAWRGLWFEYAAGQSVTDPVVYTQARSSIAYEINNQGGLTQLASGVLADGHYPNPLVDGLQTTLLGPAITNDVTNPEALDNASWSKNGVTIAANALAAPDGNLTADRLVENVANSTHYVSATAWAITAGDVLTGVAFVHAAGRTQGSVYFQTSPTFNAVGVRFDLAAGTITSSFIAGTGVLLASKIVALAGGWFMIWWRGTCDNTQTAATLTFLLFNGSDTYTGDGASGLYLWGATAVHGAANTVARYTPTTSSRDDFKAPMNGAPGALWMYAKWVECGTAFCTSYPRMIQVGRNLSSTSFYFIIFSNKSNSANNRYGFEAYLGSGAIFGVDDWPTAAPLNFGDVIEILATINAAGFGQLRVAVNGGTEAVFGAPNGPGGAFPATYDDPIIHLSDDAAYGQGTQAFSRVKIGPLATGPSAVNTIAAARAQ